MPKKCFNVSVRRSLKGQCHEIFYHFFYLRDSNWAPYEQANTVSRTFSFSRRLRLNKIFKNYESKFVVTFIIRFSLFPKKTLLTVSA